MQPKATTLSELMSTILSQKKVVFFSVQMVPPFPNGVEIEIEKLCYMRLRVMYAPKSRPLQPLPSIQGSNDFR